MNNLTLLIPANKESESLPVFLNELNDYSHKKMIVLQEEDIETIFKTIGQFIGGYRVLGNRGQFDVEGIKLAMTSSDSRSDK